jgi:hypothetical protein
MAKTEIANSGAVEAQFSYSYGDELVADNCSWASIPTS